jgi:hypothetical protein
MSAKERMEASAKGYENGLGAMSAEERMEASAKGYENGLGAMSVEERMAASAKGYENGLGAMSVEERMASRKKGNKMGIAWEEKYAEFVSYDGMPERGTKLHTWQQTQFGNGPFSLNAKIREENEENVESTVWREQRVKLFDCVEQKNSAKIGNAWERKYAEFVSYDGMPERGTPLHTWQKHQLGNGPVSLNAKIQKERAENEDGTVWSERIVKLANCVAKRRE